MLPHDNSQQNDPQNISAARKIRIDRYNNFDFLRVLFAVSVIVTHSYPLYGLADIDWLLQTTKTVSFSNLGLGGFFCISGYLVYQSAQRATGYLNFIWKRILRIFPGLIVNVLFVALVMGAIVSGTSSYYQDSSVYSYILKNIGLYNLQYCIDGVFTTNPFGCSINGSLWTLCYEFTFYLLFVVLFINKGLNKYIAWLTAPLFVALLYTRWKYPHWETWIPNTGMQANQIIHFGLWFLAGVVLAITSQAWLKYKVVIAIATFALLLTLFTTKLPVLALYIIWPLFVLSFGSCKSPVISRLDKIGDPSYGIYIYGFVVQQLLAFYFYPKLSFYAFIGISVLLSICLGYISWFGVEKKALRWKKRSKDNVGT